MHFKDFKLHDTHVLEPRWVTEAVYKIVNSIELAEGKGILILNQLDKILEKKDKDDYYYPPDKYVYIIDLMKKFELCFKIDEESVLIPDLLDVQEPEIGFDYDKALRFLIKYDYLPRSIMPRFIVKMHKDIKSKLNWRTGVVLYDKIFNSTAVIKEDVKEKKVFIYVSGSQKRDYFSIIRYAFLSINDSFEKLKFIEKVLMPDNPEVTVSYNHLAKLEAMGISEYIPDGSDKEYKVKELLGSIVEPQKTEEKILQILEKFEEQSTSKESFVDQVSSVVKLQPGIFGMSVDISELIKRFYKKKKQNKLKPE